MKIAGIDIGTNTVRGVVISFEGKVPKVINSFREITGLGRGMEDGMLKKDAMERTYFGVLKIMKSIKERGVEEVFLGGTHSLRVAKNRDEFISLIEEKTGKRVEVLTGEEEAIYTANGIFLGKKLKGNILCVDIGGGSTEFIFVSQGNVKSFVSLKMGLLFPAEKYLRSDPPDKRDLKAIEDYFLSFLLNQSLLKNKFTGIYGSCGTFTTSVMILKGLREYRRELIEGFYLKRRDFEQVKNLILQCSSEDRLKLPGVERGKEDLTVTGVIFVDTLFRLTKIKGIHVSENGWLEGYIVKKYLDNFKSQYSLSPRKEY